MSKLLNKLFNHERYQSIAVIIAALFLVWVYGCQSRCESLMVSGRQITRGELELEISSLIQQAEMRSQSIHTQDQVKRLLFQQALIAAGGVPLNPVTVLASVGSLLGLGASVDNIRKRKEIKTLKSNGT